MGLAKKAVLALLMVVAACGIVADGAVYKVGDSAGWTNTGNHDYKAWAASKSFQVGDTIVFEYNKDFQNVIRVTHKKFRDCNATAAYFTVNTGNDEFTIKRGGHYYFICGLPGHCEAGQKVDIRVPRTTTPTTSSPAAAPSPTPARPTSAPRHLPPLTPYQSPDSVVGGTAPAPAPSVPQSSTASSVSCKLWSSIAVLGVIVSGFAY